MLDQARSISETRTLRIYLDAGISDYASPGVSELSDALKKNKIEHEVSFTTGGHEYPYWERNVPEYLRFYSAKWPGVPRPR
jgi:enterochelin esterase-like enzyme